MRPWTPKRVLVTPAALGWAHGAAMVARAETLGCEVVQLKSDRLSGLPDTYRDAKTTLAIITASPSRRRLEPIPPSADWRFDLAAGCPAHCAYCYLAGSLAGPPIVRAYANLPEILDMLEPALGHGAVTSAGIRASEGTTYECSCYTDPLGIEHITGSLAATIAHFGAWQAPVQLRFTTKFDAVEPLLKIDHQGRTRVRFSVNSRGAGRFEGGAPRMEHRLQALRAMALAGYPVGLTVAPILPLPLWAQEYDQLFADVATALDGTGAAAMLTVELITHRFTAKSKGVLTGWYPGSALDMDEANRTRKLTKFGSAKFVFPKTEMAAMRANLEASLQQHLPQTKLLYWT